MLSTLLEHQIYLGFVNKQPLEEKNYEMTFIGGTPIFLYQPDNGLLECNSCNKQKMTFVCQIFCPFEAEHTYNRVLYVFYCDKCYRMFRCIKQQTSKTKEISKVDIAVRIVMEKSFEISSQSFQVKQLQKIIKNAHNEVEEQAIQQAEDEDFDDEEDVMDVKQFESESIEQMGFKNGKEEGSLSSQMSKQKLQSLKHASQTLKEEKEQKDLVFEQYKKVMHELDDPVLLYTNIPVPYNSQIINPKHFCKFCEGKLTLQLQLTSKILILNQKLVNMDWGSLMVFTCSNSCDKSLDQCVVVQYQVDAIKQSDIALLRKRQKNKKIKAQKQRSKSKKKQELKEVKQFKKGKQVKQQKGDDEQEGDWD